ncbi:MAG TPA: adenylate/guanylate cyclase domain-containing protein, partial [Candidatus Acidoferrum sp.]|nr:adenylate/guanylate cyclase domain-containing protein [Candidatus Acidoferrum sp.]
MTQTTQEPAALPTGTVTFLFTDIEGSTKLLQDLGAGYHAVLMEHRGLVGSAMTGHGGRIFGSEGDALFVVFADAASAAAAAADAQRALAEHVWPDGRSLRVRMGVHSGEVALIGEDYVGLALHTVARISAAGHGGQVLLSDAARSLVGGNLPAGVTLRDLGEHRLKDLARPERLFELVIGGLEANFPAL